MNIKRRQVLYVLGGMGMAALESACGYSLAGRGSFLPSYVQTIGIPVFGNLTTVFNVEQLLTQRVRQEFIGRGKYQVKPDATNADAVLNGEVTSISVTPTAFTADHQAARYVFIVTMKIEFTDVRANRNIWENPALVFREEYELTNASGALDPNAFFGQESNALERIADDFAKSVVSAILEGF